MEDWLWEHDHDNAGELKQKDLWRGQKKGSRKYKNNDMSGGGEVPRIRHCSMADN